MVRNLVWSLLAGGIVAATTYFWRHFPPSLAFVSGLSVGVLTFMSLRAAGRLFHIYRR